MSLFDAQAVKIHNQLEQMRVDPRVFVATSVNPKIVGGMQPLWHKYGCLCNDVELIHILLTMQVVCF